MASTRDSTLGSVVIAVGGGSAIFAGVGSPTNKMIGVGFGPLPTDAELAAVERLFAERETDLQAEISSLADPALHARLVARGYEPRGFENVLGHPRTGVPPAASDGITVERAQRDDRPAWVDAAVAAFATPDTGGVGGDAIPQSKTLRCWLSFTVDVPGLECLAARSTVASSGMGRCASMTESPNCVAQARCPRTDVAACRPRSCGGGLRAREAGCAVAVVTTPAGVEVAAERATRGLLPVVSATTLGEVLYLRVRFASEMKS